MTGADAPIVTASGIAKTYGGVRALDRVDLAIRPGRVHALVGENGAGKSTLMKILAGAEQPDSGTVALEGRPVRFVNVREANEAGIAIVFQELSLFPDLDVLANLFATGQPGRFGLVSRSRMRRRAQPVLDELGLAIPAEAIVGRLTLAEQQQVEIAKALLAESRVLILDEPNSALNAAESERLFALVRTLRSRGVAILYVSHRLEEVFAIADELTVLRNGRVAGSGPIAATTIPEVVSLMIGRSGEAFFAGRRRQAGTGPGLVLEGIGVAGLLEGLDLTVAPGEIVGLAGLEGSGVGAVLDIVFGQRAPDRGRVVLPGGAPGPRSIPAAVRAGVALVPADRRQDGLMLDQSIAGNLGIVAAGVLGRLGAFVRQAGLDRMAERSVHALNIRTDSVTRPVGQLSGGNQQKVVLGKWLEVDPRLVLLNDPTRGVDIGAKAEIYRMIHDLADDGRIVLFTSTELPEYVHVCDRVVVFYRGRTCGEIAKADLTTHRLLEAINLGRIGEGGADPAPLAHAEGGRP